jgi:general secretion pathway protein H
MRPDLAQWGAAIHRPIPASRPRHCAFTGPQSAFGFTLLELLVVLALATLLVALVPPLIGSAMPGVELKSSARRVAAGLRLAREEAIRSGRGAAFVIDLEARRFQVDGGYRRVQLPEDIDLKLEAAAAEMMDEKVGAVRFYPDGSSTGGRIVLARRGEGFQVGVQWLTGRIRTAPWEGEP